MYQVTFSDQSIAALNQLPIHEQMQLIELISSFNADQMGSPSEPFGKFARNGKTFYRLRFGAFRCYFEINNGILYSHYFLHKKTLKDFIFRNSLPITEEQLVEEDQSFWKYLEEVCKIKD